MHQFSESQTKVPWSAIILKIVIFIRICMVNGQGMPIQLICHTEPLQSQFSIDGASRYFGVRIWQILVHFLILVCSFQWCVLFCVWPSFIGAILSVLKAYSDVFLVQKMIFLFYWPSKIMFFWNQPVWVVFFFFTCFYWESTVCQSTQKLVEMVEKDGYHTIMGFLSIA